MGPTVHGYSYDCRVASNADVLALVHRYCEKYARILGVDKLPKIFLRDNLGSKWLGRLTFRQGQENVMEIQARAFSADALERVVAHEMAHHAEMLALGQERLARLKIGIKPADHGPEWEAYAAQINAVMGAGFVTKTSDQSYGLSTEVKPYLLLIEPIGSRLGYAVGVRLSPKMREYADKHVAAGAKLVSSTDAAWARGPKIGSGRWAVPKEPPLQERLQQLFNS